MIKVGLLVAGPKGLGLLRSIHTDCEIAFVSSHEVKGMQIDALTEIRVICSQYKYPFIEHTQLDASVLKKADIILLAGWRFLTSLSSEKLVVFHDSLLPKYRGFSPTVTALIQGESEIGVTAFQPAELSDTGPIYDQIRIPIQYPIKVKSAYETLEQAYAQAAKNILKNLAAGSLRAVPQNELEATYCIWRGEEDYLINWNWPAKRIARFIDAVGWPYGGAKTRYGTTEIIIDDVGPEPEMQFEDRAPGKIWAIKNGSPVVICGDGILTIRKARAVDGSPFAFTKLRERFKSPI